MDCGSLWMKDGESLWIAPHVVSGLACVRERTICGIRTYGVLVYNIVGLCARRARITTVVVASLRLAIVVRQVGSSHGDVLFLQRKREQRQIAISRSSVNPTLI